MNDNGTFDILELVMLVLFVAIEVLCVTNMVRMSTGGFGTQIEKTALKTSGEVKAGSVKLTKDDAILMLAIADRYEPEPATIQYNITSQSGPSIPIDSNFLIDRTSALLKANNELTTATTVNIRLYVGSTGVRKWVVTK